MAPTKPTILFLASWYPTPINKSHGIFIRNHALALSNFCNVIVAYAYTDSKHNGFTLTKTKVNDHFEEWIVAYKKTTVSIPILSEILRYLNFKKAYTLLINELSTHNIKIKAIQVNAVYPAAIALQLFLKKWPVPYTVLEHWTGYLPEDGNYKGSFITHYTRKAINKATKIFYVSEKQKSAMQSHQLTGNYELIYNVIDTSVFNLKQNNPLPRPLLLHVSSLDDTQKNVTGILNTIRILQQKNFDFDFVFVGGDNQIIEQHKKFTEKLGLANVTFVGSKTQIEIAGYMQKAAALILFSNYENMPVVVLEALACGLHIISSNTGYLESIVQPGFGTLIEIGNEKELEKNIAELLQGKVKINREQMNAFIVSKASEAVVGKQLFDFYRSFTES